MLKTRLRVFQWQGRVVMTKTTIYLPNGNSLKLKIPKERLVKNLLFWIFFKKLIRTCCTFIRLTRVHVIIKVSWVFMLQKLITHFYLFLYLEKPINNQMKSNTVLKVGSFENFNYFVFFYVILRLEVQISWAESHILNRHLISLFLK